MQTLTKKEVMEHESYWPMDTSSELYYNMLGHILEGLYSNPKLFENPDLSLKDNLGKLYEAGTEIAATIANQAKDNGEVS